MSFLKIDYEGWKPKEGEDITRDEIESVIYNTKTRFHFGSESVYLIGFSNRKRIIIVEYHYRTIKHIKIKNSQLPPHEIYIEDFYCQCEEKRSSQ